jgi:hypothetical protein
MGTENEDPPARSRYALAAEAEVNSILLAMLALGSATAEHVATQSGIALGTVKRRLNQNGPGCFRADWKKVEHRTDGTWALTNLGRRIAEQAAREQGE